MANVVTENCICCKYTDCVEVCRWPASTKAKPCPSSIPMRCIDGVVCEPECHADTIKPDIEPRLTLNKELSFVWPNTIRKQDPIAADVNGRAGKLELLSQSSRSGDWKPKTKSCCAILVQKISLRKQVGN